jgi:hypothetical protein
MVGALLREVNQFVSALLCEYIGRVMATFSCWKERRDRRCYFYCREYYWCLEGRRWSDRYRAPAGGSGGEAQPGPEQEAPGRRTPGGDEEPGNRAPGGDAAEGPAAEESVRDGPVE